MSLPHATDPALTMAGWRYHLTKSCPAVSAEFAGGENVVRTLMIPKDQLITVTGGPFNGARWVDITWHLKPYMMFTAHLRNSGRRLGIAP